MAMDPIDVVLTFDTTGSMYPCLSQVRRTLVQMVKDFSTNIPTLRIGVIAHGDYCDARTNYVTKLLDLTTNMRDVTDFIQKVGPTGGGDSPECYELVLHQARTQMTWKSGRNKVIIMVGDDVPHEASYSMNKDKIDWKNELGLISEASIKIYGVHCMPGCRRHSRLFYQTIASQTNGAYLTLDQFRNINDLIMGVCYKQKGEEEFASFVLTVSKGGRMTKDLEFSFRAMSPKTKLDFGVRKSGGTRYSYEEDGLHPVDSGRFQVIPVDEEITIQNFIRNQGVSYQAGRGFYELVRYGKKAYKIQQYKEIILQDRESGDMLNGPEVRKILGLLPQIEGGKGSGDTERLAPNAMEKYRVFIQSTSYTRKLVPGSNLLYEVEDWRR
jgi:hypothetical protein